MFGSEMTMGRNDRIPNGFVEDWRNIGSPPKLSKFLKLGVALSLRYLLTDLLLI